MLIIKVLGSGCSNCEKLSALVKSSVTKLGVEADIAKVTDYDKIMQYHVLMTPGLVINEKLVSAGRIPSEAEISSWIMAAVELV